MSKYRWRVDIIESERNWGQKIDERKFFDDEQEAVDFAREFNSKNTEDTVPDWYMRAETPVKVQVES